MTTIRAGAFDSLSCVRVAEVTWMLNRSSSENSSSQSIFSGLSSSVSSARATLQGKRRMAMTPARRRTFLESPELELVFEVANVASFPPLNRTAHVVEREEIQQEDAKVFNPKSFPSFPLPVPLPMANCGDRPSCRPGC